MPWEDCCFAHTDDNRFTNTNTNAWFGIKDDSERDFSSKGMAIGAARREIGGAGLGFGKRPYLHSDYAEMLKSTTDKEAFDRMASRGYFPGRTLLERPYGSRHYQEMKYQKPVAPLLAETPSDLQLERPEFEIPTVPAMGSPMWVHGYICLTDVSRLKVCVVDDGTTDGIEIYDGISNRYTKEALLTTAKRFNVLIHNIYQVRQTSPYVYIFVHDSSSWRKCTSTECGGRICDKVEVIPGKEVWGAYDCWLSYFDNTRWEVTGYKMGSWDAANNRWEADQVPGYSTHRLQIRTDGPLSPTWHVNYRPNYMRVTFTGVSPLDMELQDQQYTAIVNESTALSGIAYSIIWDGYDIRLMYFYHADTIFYITNIEFQ